MRTGSARHARVHPSFQRHPPPRYGSSSVCKQKQRFGCSGAAAGSSHGTPVRSSRICGRQAEPLPRPLAKEEDRVAREPVRARSPEPTTHVRRRQCLRSASRPSTSKPSTTFGKEAPARCESLNAGIGIALLLLPRATEVTRASTPRSVYVRAKRGAGVHCERRSLQRNGISSWRR